jgi:hypothetical protein
MPLAFGFNSLVQFEWETTYGTFPSTSAFKTLPVVSYDPNITQPWEGLDVVGLGSSRDISAHNRGLLTIEPRVEAPVDLVNSGYWLRALFGDPVTTGTTDRTHVFKSGAFATSGTPPSMGIEHGNPNIPNGYQRVAGVRADTLEVSFRPGETVQTMTLGLVGRTATRHATSVDGTSTAATFTPFLGPVMTATRAGSALGRVTGATLRFSNGLEKLREANRADSAITEAWPGVTEVSGSLDIRMDDETILADSEGTTPIALTFGYSISATQALTFAIPRAYLERAGIGARGRAGIQATFAFRGEYDGTAQAALTATLLNQQASYA